MRSCHHTYLVTESTWSGRAFYEDYEEQRAKYMPLGNTMCYWLSVRDITFELKILFPVFVTLVYQQFLWENVNID